MTIKECIDIVDNAKPNQYGIKEKVMWLSFVDETIINDVLKTHEGYDGRYDDFKGYTEDKLSVPLIVPSPYDRLYPQYIKMMIDSENGETARYNNSAALYNTYLNEYKKYYNKTHMPINATQKIPSPVSININSALSEAQIEYIKRQLYYMLSQDVGEVISHDKLYNIAMEYYQNNTEVLKGKDGKDGTLWTPLYFELDIKKGENKKAKFDFNRNIFYWGNLNLEFNGLYREDYPNADEWTVGDFFVSNDRKILQIKQLEWPNSEFLNVDVTCISEHNLIVDQVFDGDSENAVSGKALVGVLKVLSEQLAFADFSNVSNEDFRAKAEAAGVGGDAGLADEKNFMVFKGVVSELPETANEGEVYKVVSASVEKGEQVGTYNGIAGCAAITPNSIWGYANGADFVSAVRNAYLETSERPAPVVIESDGNTYHILVSGYHYEDSPIGTIDYIDGVTNVNAEVQLDDAIVYKGIAKKTEEILTRFNGEWVEL
jgi:hypothetical protein